MSADQPNPLLAIKQGFPQVLRTWRWAAPPPLGGGALQNLMGGLSQYMGGAWGA